MLLNNLLLTKIGDYAIIGSTFIKKGVMVVITLQDMRGNLLQGEVIISDKNKLIQYRNQLLEETYDGKDANFEVVSLRKNIPSFDGDACPGVFSKNGLLVINSNFVPDYFETSCCVFDYQKEIIACKHLNTVLLLSSLLDNSDRYYPSIIASQFYNAGIFNVDSFDETWKICRKNLLGSEDNVDLEAFRDAFVYGGIAYQVQDSWLKAEIAKMNVLKTKGFSLQDVVTNTKILGVDNVLRRTK